MERLPAAAKPVLTRMRRTRLKRAQSERVPSIEGAAPPILPPPRPIVPHPESALHHFSSSTDKLEAIKPVTPKLQRPRQRGILVKSMTFTAKDVDPPASRFMSGKMDPRTRNEEKRREAVWDLFQSETAFLLDHLMVMKHVRYIFLTFIISFSWHMAPRAFYLASVPRTCEGIHWSKYGTDPAILLLYCCFFPA